jgi:hypothetical protein
VLFFNFGWQSLQKFISIHIVQMYESSGMFSSLSQPSQSAKNQSVIVAAVVNSLVWDGRNVGRVGRRKGGAPRAASQSRTVLSSELDPTSLLSGEKAIELTRSEWPLSGSPCGAPVAASQSRTVLSSEPDAISLPSGEKTTELTDLNSPQAAHRAAPPWPRPRAGPCRLSPTRPACRPARRRPSRPNLSGPRASAVFRSNSLALSKSYISR